jgi:hypothetical protein
MLRQYKIGVPRKTPENFIEDTVGRKWIPASMIELDESQDTLKREDISNLWFLSSQQQNDWFVWFKRLECPAVGEKIHFKDEENTSVFKVIEAYQSYNVKRAVIKLVRI